MEKELLNALTIQGMEEVCKHMIRPSLGFVGERFSYNVNLNADAIDDENLLLRTDCWMNNILEFDDVTDHINRVIYIHEKDSETVMDYGMFDVLDRELGYDLEKIDQGYTYNDPDQCLLDRDIHYTVFEYQGEYYTIFSVHYGADARAGFGSIACFKIKDLDYFYIGMEIRAFDEEDTIYLTGVEIEHECEFNKDLGKWVHIESGKELELYSSANGF